VKETMARNQRKKAAQSAGLAGFGMSFKLQGTENINDVSVQNSINGTNLASLEFDMSGSTFDAGFLVPGQLTAYDVSGNVISAKPTQFSNFNDVMQMNGVNDVQLWVDNLPANTKSVALGLDLSPSVLPVGYHRLDMDVRYAGQVIAESTHSSWVTDQLCTAHTGGLLTTSECFTGGI
jgi:hypothetical protein